MYTLDIGSTNTGNEMKIGQWKSKTSDLVVEVISEKNGIVWYIAPSFIGAQPCEIMVWFSSMEEV